MVTPKEFRRHLHQNPELSFQEFETSEFIKRELTAAGLEWQPIARTGLLVRISKGENRSRAVVLRADIDALPIQEQSGVEWESKSRGVMHACGHDIHSAILYGVLSRLKDADFDGSIFGLFQPAEESNPGGAQLVLAEEPFSDYDVVAVLGEHVEPELEVGELGFKQGRYMASNDEIYFSVVGRGGHAAMRTISQDSVSLAAKLILELTQLNSERIIISIGRVEALGATNVIPDVVSLQGTMRTFDAEVRGELKRRIKEICDSLAQEHDMQIEFTIKEGYPPVVNDEKLVERAIATAQQQGFAVKKLGLRATSEDFGRYCEKYPSLFYRLGVGRDSGRVHTASFNPDERAIDVGIEFMYSLALNFLKE